MKRLALIASIVAISGTACGGRVDGTPGRSRQAGGGTAGEPGAADTPGSAGGDAFAPKSHSTWDGVYGYEIIAQDIGHDTTYGDTVYTWLYGSDDYHGTVYRGSSTRLHSISAYPFTSPKPISHIVAIAIAKNTQKVYTYYWFHDAGSLYYPVGRLIGTTSDLGKYDDNFDNSSVLDNYLGWDGRKLVEAGVSNNGYVYWYWYDNHGYLTRFYGTSLSPRHASYVVTYDTGYNIKGLAFNASGTEYVWYACCNNYGGPLETTTNSLDLW